MIPLQVDTAAMLAAADAFHQLYTRAERTLEAARKQMNSCQWDSPAGEQLKQAYLAYQNQYSQRYLQLMHNYELFLRNTAAPGYDQQEQANVTLANLVGDNLDISASRTGFTLLDQAARNVQKTTNSLADQLK